MKLLENVSQAESLLKKIDFNLNNENYLGIKQQLLQTNQIGYLGFVIKLSIINNKVNFVLAQRLVKFIINNKQIIKQLPKPLVLYNSISEIINDIRIIKINNNIIKFGNLLTNKSIKNELKNNPSKFHNEERNINFFMKIKSEDKKEFLAKTDKYSNADELFDDLNNFIENYDENFNFNTVYNKINSLDTDSAKILFGDKTNNIILVRIYDYNASKIIGSMSWCIVGSEENFDLYTKNGNNMQYFLFNFNINVSPNEKLLAFTINKDNNITASHDRYDKLYPQIKTKLNEWGISEKIYMYNTREYSKRNIDSLLNNSLQFRENADRIIYADNYIPDPEKKDNFIPNPKIKNNHIEYAKLLLDKLLFGKFSEFDYKNNGLDLIVNAFQNYKILVVDKIKYVEQIQKFNILPRIIHNLEKNDDNYIKVFYKILNSNINVNTDTKREILHYLKDSGIDVLNLVKQIKMRKGDELTDSEFGLLAKKGEDFKHLIFNKINKLRKGEDVNFNFNEIKYGINNGFEKTIKHYYLKKLPEYLYDQLSYDDMQIYKSLGLFNNIEKIIINKSNNFGVDSLNSIEKSIYDIAKRK